MLANLLMRGGGPARVILSQRAEDTPDEWNAGTGSGWYADASGLYLRAWDYRDGFDTDTSADYTAYGATDSVWTWDTANSRLVASGPNDSQRVVTASSFADGFVETNIDRADNGGLVLRCADASNYYLLNILDNQNIYGIASNLILYARVGGTYTQIASADCDIPRGALSRIRFEAQGSALRAYLNGVQQLSATDTSISAAGKCGLRVDGASTSYVTQYYDLKYGALSYPDAARTSPALSLPASVGDSRVDWTASVAAGATLTMESSIDGGATWSALTNGAAIPGVIAGADLTGKSLLLRQRFGDGVTISKLTATLYA